MRVGIDCRKIADFGIGTYIRGLLHAMPEIYVAFGPAGIALPAGVEHVVVDVPNYSIRELFAVGQAADRARLDLFHAPHYVLPQMRTPAVVTIHDLIHLRRGLAQRMYARTMMRRAVRRARGVLTVSEAVAKEIRAQFGSPATVTPNGVDDVFFSEPPSSYQGRLHYLFVGNDKAHKNAEAAVAAMANVENAQLIMVGGRFERFAGNPRIFRMGFVDQATLLVLYRLAYALVIPSVEEGFGLPALEAMAAGTPVITSHAPALVEVTGDAALHVTDRELADAMNRVRSDASLHASLVDRGRARAAQFTWRECARRTRRAYEEAIARA